MLNNTLQMFTLGYHKIKIESFELQSCCCSKAGYATGAGWSSTTDTFRLYNFDFRIWGETTLIRNMVYSSHLTLFLLGVVTWHSYMGWFHPVPVEIGLKDQYICSVFSKLLMLEIFSHPFMNYSIRFVSFIFLSMQGNSIDLGYLMVSSRHK
jgi:hypothetical protein